MGLTRIITTTLFGILISLSQTQAKEWRGIVPLKSTRADVERLLGSPAKPGIPFYEAEDEGVYIVYSARPCEETWEGAWNVPPETVVSIRVTPKKELYLRGLQVDKSKYKKIEHLHISGRLTYVNEEEGISIETDSLDPEHERVIRIDYGPTRNDKHLACPDGNPSRRTLKCPSGPSSRLLLRR